MKAENVGMSQHQTVPIAVFFLALFSLLAGCTSSEDRQNAYFEKASVLFQAGDMERAELEAKNVLQINPNHVGARYLWARIHGRKKNWRQMYANLKFVVDLEPNHLQSRIKLGELYYRTGDLERSLVQAEAALSIAPSSLDALVLRGSIHYKQGEFDLAINHAHEVLAASPDHVGAISILTEVYREHDPERALAIIGEGIELQSKNATLKLLKISVLEDKGKVQEVIDVYRELVSEHPENLYFHYLLVKFLEANERIDEAEVLLRNIVETRPESLQLKLWLADFIAGQRNLNLAETTVLDFIKRQPDIYELRFALGRIYSAMNKYDQAELVYRDVVHMDVDGADAIHARNEIVKLMFTQGRKREAGLLLDEIFAIESENVDGLITRATVAISEHEYIQAVTDLRTALKHESDSVKAIRLLGQAHELVGKSDLAMDNYRQALSMSPGDRQSLLGLARLLIQDGQIEVAIEILSVFLHQNPSSDEGTILLVASLSNQRRWDEAIEIAEAYEARFRDSLIGRYLKGRIRFDKGEYQLAQQIFLEVLEVEPSAVEALNLLIKCFYAMERHEDALAYLSDHLQSYPTHGHAFVLLGDYFLRYDQLDESRLNYNIALEIDPKQKAAYLGIGRIYERSGEYHLALKAYERALKEHPNDTLLMLERAATLESIGNYIEASESYEKVLALDSSQVVAANNLAMLLVDHLKSESNLSRALALSSGFETKGNPAFLDTRGWVLYHSGKFSEARLLIREALKTAESATYRYHLGRIYLALGDKSEAANQLNASLALNSGFPEKEHARALVDKL